MILLIDNYDSFTYNLYQAMGVINPDIKVIRNDKIDVDGIRRLNPSHIVISPGPGYPLDAGVTLELIKKLHKEYNMLGICLGHQAIAQAFGATITHCSQGPVHGKKDEVHISTACPIFYGLPPVIEAGRYHSLAVKQDTLPDCLHTTAETKDSVIMGICHSAYNVFGIQFHPESVLTPYGQKIIENFLNLEVHHD